MNSMTKSQAICTNIYYCSYTHMYAYIITRSSYLGASLSLYIQGHVSLPKYLDMPKCMPPARRVYNSGADLPICLT